MAIDTIDFRTQTVLTNDALTNWGSAASAANHIDLYYLYNGGAALLATGALTQIAAGSVLLQNNATNYVERTYAGVVTSNTVGFTPTAIPMARVSTVASRITAILDRRADAGAGPFPYYPLRTTEVGVTDTRYYFTDPRRWGADPTGVTAFDAGFANIQASYAAITQTLAAQAPPVMWPEGIFLFTAPPAALTSANCGGMRGVKMMGTAFKFNPTAVITQVATRAATSGQNRVPTTAESLTDATIGELADSAFALVTSNGTPAAAPFTVGRKYTITTIGTTDYTLIGAAANTIGSTFVATGVGSGTGTAAIWQNTFAIASGALTRSAGSWLTDGFAVGMTITIEGYQTGTDGDYVIATASSTNITTTTPLTGNQTQASDGNPRAVSRSAKAFVDRVVEIVAGTGAGQKRFIRRATGGTGGVPMLWLVDAWQLAPDNTSTYRVLEHSVLWDVRPAISTALKYDYFIEDFAVVSDVTPTVPITAVRVVGGHGTKVKRLRLDFTANQANDQWSQALVIAGYDESEYGDLELIAARPQSFQGLAGYSKAVLGADTTVYRNIKRYTTSTHFGNTRTATGTVSITTGGVATFSAVQTPPLAVDDVLTIAGVQYSLASIVGTNGSVTVPPAVAITTAAYQLAWINTCASVEFSSSFSGLTRATWSGLQMSVGGNGCIHCVAPTYFYDVHFGDFQYEGGTDFPKTRPSVNLICASSVRVWLGHCSFGAYAGMPSILKVRGVVGFLAQSVYGSTATAAAPYDIDSTVTDWEIQGYTYTGSGRPITETPLPAPRAPAIAQVGTAGAASDTYVITAVSGIGAATNGSSASSTALSNAVLSGTNYNNLTWSGVTAGAAAKLAAYNIYRTATSRSSSTGSTTLGATEVTNADGSFTTTYTRAAGSFVTDGFVPNMTVTPSGAGFDPSVRYVASVAALSMVMQSNSVSTAAAQAAGRTLVGQALGQIGSVGVTTVTAGAFIVGVTYLIVSVGTTNFVAIGATSNTVGVSFVATGVGSGTGTASGVQPAYADQGALLSASSPPIFNSTGTIIAFASGKTANVGLWNSTRGVRRSAQESAWIAAEQGFSASYRVQANSSIIIDHELVQVAGSGDSLELEARWNQGSLKSGNGGCWLVNGATGTSTPLARLLYGSPDASDVATDVDCIAVVCGNENGSNGYSRLYNNKSVDRWVHVRWRIVKGQPGAESSDGVAYPLTRLRGYTEAVAVPALASGVLTLDLSVQSHFVVARNANITSIVLSGVPTLDLTSNGVRRQVSQFTLMLNSSGAFTMALPAGWKPITGTAYTAWSGTGKSDLLTVWSYDGTTWYYSAVGGGTT